MIESSVLATKKLAFTNHNVSILLKKDHYFTHISAEEEREGLLSVDLCTSRTPFTQSRSTAYALRLLSEWNTERSSQPHRDVELLDKER